MSENKMITTPGGNPTSSENPHSSTDEVEARILGASQTCNNPPERPLGTPSPSGTCLTEDMETLDLGDGGESTKGTHQRPRHNLGGAGKKRLKRLLAQGIPYEIAVVKARENANNNTPSVKRPQSEEIDNKTKKRKGDPVQGPSYSDMISTIRMAVTHKDFPEVLLTTKDMDDIKSAFMELMWESDTPSLTPISFSDCLYRTGYMVFLCRDEGTSNWIKDNTTKLVTQTISGLKSILEEEIPKGKILEGFFHDVANLDTPMILKGLTRQNPGLNVPNWRILRRENSGKGVSLTVSMDHVAFKALQEQHLNVNFKFQQVKLRARQAYKKPDQKPKLGQKAKEAKKASTQTQRAPKHLCPRERVQKAAVSSAESDVIKAPTQISNTEEGVPSTSSCVEHKSTVVDGSKTTTEEKRPKAGQKGAGAPKIDQPKRTQPPRGGTKSKVTPSTLNKEPPK